MRKIEIGKNLLHRPELSAVNFTHSLNKVVDLDQNQSCGIQIEDNPNVVMNLDEIYQDEWQTSRSTRDLTIEFNLPS